MPHHLGLSFCEPLRRSRRAAAAGDTNISKQPIPVVRDSLHLRGIATDLRGRTDMRGCMRSARRLHRLHGRHLHGRSTRLLECVVVGSSFGRGYPGQGPSEVACPALVDESRVGGGGGGGGGGGEDRRQVVISHKTGTSCASICELRGYLRKHRRLERALVTTSSGLMRKETASTTPKFRVSREPAGAAQPAGVCDLIVRAALRPPRKPRLPRHAETIRHARPRGCRRSGAAGRLTLKRPS